MVATTDDFVVRYPTLGSSQPAVSETVLPCMPAPECKGPTRPINISSGVDLYLEHVLLANRAISFNADTEPLLYTCNQGDEYRCWVLSNNDFYPGFGLRVSDEHGITHQFNNWDALKYAMENIAPIPLDESNRQTEDWFIRLTMFVVEQLAEDQGWWKFHEWTGGGGVQFPRGDRFTDDGRSFPALAYTWAHLAMRPTPQGWVHVPGDADDIYRQLQQTYSSKTDWDVGIRCLYR